MSDDYRFPLKLAVLFKCLIQALPSKYANFMISYIIHIPDPFQINTGGIKIS